ncbi:MAG: CCDC90 family protein, partial [Gemmataceae bacterium]|nr:CCDC90 family protein [Gemmataceae bacterium]
MIAFDTLKYAKHLRQAGFTPEQAEGHAAALLEALQSSTQELATQHSVDQFRQETKTEFVTVRQEIDQLRQETKAEFVAVRHEIDQ